MRKTGTFKKSPPIVLSEKLEKMKLIIPDKNLDLTAPSNIFFDYFSFAFVAADHKLSEVICSD
jgi:hypothetical protein